MNINIKKITKILIFISLLIASFTDAINIKSFEAKFIQTIIKNNNLTITYNGDIFVKNKKAFWRYVTPFKKYIYIKKNKVTIIEPLLEQAIITTVNKQFNMLHVLKNAKTINKNTLQASVGDIVYTIKLKNGVIKSINYTNEIENKVKIIFLNQKQNKYINDNIFKINIANNYDIIIR